MKIFLTILFLSFLVGCKNSNKETVTEIPQETEITSVDISDLFQQYLKEIHKIENPPNDQTYIIIDLFVCPPCLIKYIPEVKKIYSNKKRKNHPVLIVVGDSSNPPDWFNSISKTHKNVYYDSKGFYNRINVIPNECGIVVVRDGKIIERTIITMKNYKELFGKIK